MKRLYEDLVDMKLGGAPRKEALPFDGDARLTIHRDVVYGKTHPEVQKLDAYLVKSGQPTPVLIEFHGGGWRRGSKSQFIYQGDFIRKVLDAGISVVAVVCRIGPQVGKDQAADNAAILDFLRRHLSNQENRP
jgi:acetyl esterase/lipase